MISPDPSPGTNAVARHYDELDRYYREIWGEHVHHGLWIRGDESPEEAVEKLVHLVAQRAGIRPGQSVCDVGCGYGATTRILAREFGAEARGVTISRSQYEFARERAGDGVAFELVDWTKNDLPDSSYDVIVAIESVSHVQDKSRFFSEIARVLRPGGTAIVCAWLASENPRRWQVRHLLEPICREGSLAGLGSASEYLQLLGGLGFVQLELEDLTDAVKKTWTICAARCARRFLRDGEFRRFVVAGPASRVFAKSVFRIRAAYALGALRYGLLRFTAP